MTDLDVVRILRTLHEHQVEFIVIGGFAAIAHGSTYLTSDLDICYQRSRPNLQALVDALRALNTTIRARDPGLPFMLEAKTLEFGDNFTFETDAGSLDCLGTPGGTRGFADLVRNAVDVDVEGVPVRVTSLDDLIRMKRAAGRTKDKLHLEVLEVLKEEVDGEPQ